jgi:hypothetical protein
MPAAANNAVNVTLLLSMDASLQFFAGPGNLEKPAHHGAIIGIGLLFCQEGLQRLGAYCGRSVRIKLT